MSFRSAPLISAADLLREPGRCNARRVRRLARIALAAAVAAAAARALRRLRGRLAPIEPVAPAAAGRVAEHDAGRAALARRLAEVFAVLERRVRAAGVATVGELA